ncbi:MAG: YkgJ family cysteine cluster protein [Gemmataceae bacterium]
MTEPWYAAGLSFTCTQCGNCCTGAPGYVWLQEGDAERIAAHLALPVEEVTLMHARKGHRGLTLREKNNGDCVYFEQGKGCVVYPVRPAQCRTWPFWESNLRSRKNWDSIAEGCPGIGRGPLIGVDEIVSRMREFRI